MNFSAETWSAIVQVQSVVPEGPARILPPGAMVASIDDFIPEPGDLVEEPDVAESYKALARFFERQDLLSQILAGDELVITTGGTEAEAFVVTPAASRPISSLPASFWVQILTGLATLLIGAWVWCLRRDDIAARLLALAGLSIPVFAFPAAIYSTRELALSANLFRVLSALNHFGALSFGVAMVALFLVYPYRLVSNRFLWALALVTGIIWILDTVRAVFPGPAEGHHLPSVILMAGIIVSAFLQYYATRKDPVARAAIRWFALSVCLCAGTFVSFVLLPNLFGIRPSVSQGYAFIMFGLLFVGVAIGVARYRLFELESWAFSILSYFGAGVLLLLLDAALISFVALDRPAAFALSLLMVALIYLPCRDWLARRLAPRRRIDRETLFARVVDVAMADDAMQENRWRRILQEAFLPLNIAPAKEAPVEPEIAENGLSLMLPGITGIAPLKLSYPYRGRRLFSPKDRRFAAGICAMLSHAITSRDAREKGATEERMRIARDMHDNMGAQLLSALHSETPERKDTLIRETISDLRDIVNNAARGGKTLDEVLADLKVETLERLAAAGIGVDWRVATEDGTVMLAPNVAHSLRSVLREIVSNAIRHSGARNLRVRFTTQDGLAHLIVSDDGKGLPSTPVRNGNGLSNLEARLLALHGTFALGDAKPGLLVSARFPLCEGQRT
ncbi:MAG: histidine kinase [Rhizobiaceae bacterium]|nr:histidine kinase [Rhizobiaceae bacterium]